MFFFLAELRGPLSFRPIRPIRSLAFFFFFRLYTPWDKIFSPRSARRVSFSQFFAVVTPVLLEPPARHVPLLPWPSPPFRFFFFFPQMSETPDAFFFGMWEAGVRVLCVFLSPSFFFFESLSP